MQFAFLLISLILPCFFPITSILHKNEAKFKALVAFTFYSVIVNVVIVVMTTARGPSFLYDVRETALLSVFYSLFPWPITKQNDPHFSVPKNNTADNRSGKPQGFSDQDLWVY